MIIIATLNTNWFSSFCIAASFNWEKVEEIRCKEKENQVNLFKTFYYKFLRIYFTAVFLLVVPHFMFLSTLLINKNEKLLSSRKKCFNHKDALEWTDLRLKTYQWSLTNILSIQVPSAKYLQTVFWLSSFIAYVSKTLR